MVFFIGAGKNSCTKTNTLTKVLIGAVLELPKLVRTAANVLKS